MSAKARVRVWRVFVCKTSRAQNDLDLDTTLKPLFPKSKALQALQAEFLGSAVYGGILKQDTAHASVVDFRLD